MPRLVVTKGSGIGRDHAVTTECVVGRGTDADFVLEDGNASRRHCRVLIDGVGYAVEDLGSRNGTYVNGTRIQRQSLVDGDIIRIGSSEFAFRQQGLIAPSTASAARAISVPPAIAVAKAISVPPAVAVPAKPTIARPPAISVPSSVATTGIFPSPSSPRVPAPGPARLGPDQPESPTTPSAPAPAAKPIVSPTPTKKRRTSW